MEEIAILVGLILLAVPFILPIVFLEICDRKAARKYPVTANALDAAAIAILFSTFFSAYSLWRLIPASAAFALLAVVTATAVLLSIRRESLFIAVLGLLGGFATPVLLSTGENRPIGLFSYLMLLNIGLAWVAYRQRWPVLTALTLVFTTIYQWGWVARYLDASQLPLATGIFVAFAAMSFAALVLAGSKNAEDGAAPHFEKTALLAATMPMLFAVYFAAVPEYRDHFWLLFGFLLMVDAGLVAIAIARAEPLLHAVGATVTLISFAAWLARSYTSAAWPFAEGIVGVFVLFYLFAPALANRLQRPLAGVGERVAYAAPLLLFVFPALVGLEPATSSPVLLFAPLFALVLAIAWRATTTSVGSLYFSRGVE